VDLTPDDIRELLRIFADSELQELRIETGETRLYVSRSGGAAGPAITPTPGAAGTARPPDPSPPVVVQEGAPAAAPRDGLVEIRSPLLGVFYRRPTPDRPPFVEVGDVVAPDDPVCIVDVMKMFTQVHARVAGRIVEIVATDGQLVHHDQVIMLVEPA